MFMLHIYPAFFFHPAIIKPLTKKSSFTQVNSSYMHCHSETQQKNILPQMQRVGQIELLEQVSPSHVRLLYHPLYHISNSFALQNHPHNPPTDTNLHETQESHP
mmetsp:Transcript_8304/g.11853  ORF Transcript_8304/g.11853 Transcript_8304/m.11853 type:complete len:104 (+) Transcript_8304:243-554(+)